MIRRLECVVLFLEILPVSLVCMAYCFVVASCGWLTRKRLC